MSAEEYRVVYSGQIQKKLKDMLRKAKNLGPGVLAQV
jgi:hypothetical protein